MGDRTGMVRANNKRKRSNTIEPATISIEQPLSENELFRQSLIRLFDEKCLCDVKFNVRGQLFHAHKLVLAAGNSFLGTMIMSGMSESAIDIIELDVDPVLFQYILNYIYGKPIEVPSTSIISLLGLCNSYCMMSLRDRLALILAHHLTIENCCSILYAADSYNCEVLLEAAKQLLFNNFSVISKTESFLELPASIMVQILQSDNILDCDELLLFDVVVRWVEFQPTERSMHGTNLLQCIRFPLMNSAYLSDVVKVHPMMTTSMERMQLIFEAFEHHALVACGRPGLIHSPRTKKRKQSLSFTRYNSLIDHEDAVSAVLVFGEYIISGSWDSSIKIWKLIPPPSTLPLDDTDMMDSDIPSPTTSSASSSGGVGGATAGNTTSSEGPAPVWQCIRTLADHASSIRSLCHCQGKVISCSDDGVIKVWSPPDTAAAAVGTSWTCIRSMEGHDGATNCLIDCLGRLASGGDDGTIKLWGSANNWMCEVTVHHMMLPAADTVPTNEERRGRRRVRQREEHVIEDDEEEEEEEEELDEEARARARVGVISMAVHEDKLISGGDDAIVRIWNMNSWICERILRGHTDEIWAIKIWNNALYTGSVDGTVRVWRKHWTSSSSTTTNHHPNPILGRAHTDDTIGSVLSSSSTGSHTTTFSTTLYHHPASHAHHAPPPPQYDWLCEGTIRCESAVYAICCFDNKIVTAGANKRISIWKPSSMLPNHATAASSSSHAVTSQHHLNGHSENWTLYKWLDTADDGIWCMDIGNTLPVMSGGSMMQKCRLVSGGCDGIIRVWI